MTETEKIIELLHELRKSMNETTKALRACTEIVNHKKVKQ